jgi:hypothetical protein
MMGLNSCWVPVLSNLQQSYELLLKGGEFMGQDMKVGFANPLSVSLRCGHTEFK